MAQTFSIVTGNGFIGNAQRIDTDNGRGFFQIVYASGITDANYRDWELTFKYRANYVIRVGWAHNEWYETNITANTGNAISHSLIIDSATYLANWFILNGLYALTITFEVDFQVDAWMEIDEVNFYPIT